MLYSFIRAIDNMVNIRTVSAHCDIPCKIYDPSSSQIAALTVIRMTDMLLELTEKNTLTPAEQGQFSRLVAEKENHGIKVKQEITVIWGDYFKTPQFEKFPEVHQLCHNIMQQASKCKQHIDKQMSLDLLELVNQFADIFWQSKEVSTFQATSPYPPFQPVIYPDLKS